MQKITPFLWFDDKADEAVNFYVSLFPDARVTSKTNYADDVPGPKGKVMSITFELAGQSFTALNGGPGVFSFTGAISFVVSCDTQEEVDHYWNALSAEPVAEQCGWLKDKYGVYWQIVPVALERLLSDPDPEKAHRVTRAMLKMKKLDVAALQAAYDSDRD